MTYGCGCDDARLLQPKQLVATATFACSKRKGVRDNAAQRAHGRPCRLALCLLRRQLFDAWEEAWSRLSALGKRIVSLAWRAALPVDANAAEAGRWETVQGAMTAVIATALDMGWAPPRRSG